MWYRIKMRSIRRKLVRNIRSLETGRKWANQSIAAIDRLLTQLGEVGAKFS